jgi:hypothetical protein
MLKKLFVVLAVTFAVAGTTSVTSIAFAPNAQAFGLGSIKKAAKKVGRTVKKGGKAVGREARKRGKLIKKAMTWKTTKEIGRDYGRAAKRAGTAIGRGGKAVERAAKKTGRGYREMAKCVAKGGCDGRIGPQQPGTVSDHRRRPIVSDHRS